ncbi:DUF342 domain-containing protein [Virgibacillus dakarensis]|nr:DUF342 domain-containing protein [Virgibacillus dakarensis]
MGDLQNYFYINISNDRLHASLYRTDKPIDDDLELTENGIINILKEKKVCYGVLHDTIQLIVSDLSVVEFPVIVARGQLAQHGENGTITYGLNFDTEFEKTADWNFRDVMRIPSVQKGQRLATITMPGDGKNGIDIFGKEIKARPGKPVLVKAGKNVVYHEKDHSFYAAAEGQVSINPRSIQVYEVYQINETLSMKDGNLDFVGSIVIHGDVPTGYTVKAGGDIKIYGMVEAATLIAGGSIFISEGFAGLRKGSIKADGNIHVGYINQGIAHAGDDIYVERSILHSECTARCHIYCQKGNIIGGILSAGKSVEAKDIGNRMSTQTEIVLGVHKRMMDKEKELSAEKAELLDTRNKLTVLGEKIQNQRDQQNPKVRITMLRQRNSINQTTEKIARIDEQLSQLNGQIGSETEAKLSVRGYLYSNTIVTFGKYKRKINKTTKNVQMRLEQNEISLLSL